MNYNVASGAMMREFQRMVVDRAESLAASLAGEVGLLKVGLELFCGSGPDAVRRIARHAPVFLDLKLHDIPNTVAGAARRCGGNIGLPRRVERYVSDTPIRDVVILGSGPAGYTAALYAARAGLKPLVLKGLEAGGQLMLTTEVENYPGFVDGIMGPELMDAMEKQAARFDAELLSVSATKVDLSSRPFRVEAGSQAWLARTLIVSTGASARWLGVPGETELRGRGVSACATCDGFFFRDKRLVVVGGGDTAMEEATFLTRFASKVSLIHRRDHLRASKVMQDKALSTPNISFLWNKEVVDIKDLEQGKVTSLVLRDTTNGEQSELAVDGVFIGIGHNPGMVL